MDHKRFCAEYDYHFGEVKTDKCTLLSDLERDYGKSRPYPLTNGFCHSSEWANAVAFGGNPPKVVVINSAGYYEVYYRKGSR